LRPAQGPYPGGFSKSEVETARLSAQTLLGAPMDDTQPNGKILCSVARNRIDSGELKRTLNALFDLQEHDVLELQFARAATPVTYEVHHSEGRYQSHISVYQKIALDVETSDFWLARHLARQLNCDVLAPSADPNPVEWVLFDAQGGSHIVFEDVEAGD
jgi:hypothetical protein